MEWTDGWYGTPAKRGTLNKGESQCIRIGIIAREETPHNAPVIISFLLAS